MKGRDLLRSAFSEVTARPCCWAGAKAAAEPRRRRGAANFIIFKIRYLGLTRLKCCRRWGELLLLLQYCCGASGR